MVENFNDKIKYEIINELGLLDKVKSYGWKSLTAKETGRIGGLITKKKKTIQADKGQPV
jgi:small acid-soluble spore protein F (minor alpha/beta-type SASP)